MVKNSLFRKASWTIKGLAEKLRYSWACHDSMLWRLPCRSSWSNFSPLNKMYCYFNLEFTLTKNDKIIIVASDGVW
jgi:hypothetical protein